MYAYAFRGVGLLVTAPKTFLCNFAANYIRQYTVNGVVIRAAFSLMTGANTYYMSDTEGADMGEIGSSMAQSFFFTEVAFYNVATKGDTKSVALLMSLGGIPGGGRGVDKKTGRIVDLDAKTENITEANNRVVNEWKSPSDVIKDDIASIKAKASYVRNKLMSTIKGEGAIEMRKATFEEFCKSFDIKDVLTNEMKAELYDLYMKGEWATLESRYKLLGGEWPPNRGANTFRIRDMHPGECFDRFGGYYEKGIFHDQGSYGGKENTPYTNRALKPGSINRPYKNYEVTKNIPDVQEGKTSPWFGEKGGGTQFDFENSNIKGANGEKGIEAMKEKGYIREKMDQPVVLPQNTDDKIKK